MASKKDPLVGSIVIPEYDLSDFTDIELIGEGGEATVYRANHVKQKTNFALKVQKTDPLAASSNSRINLKEAKILMQYSMHSNIARVYGLLVKDGQKNHIGYVMEFMENKCLGETIYNPEIIYDMNQFYSWIRQAGNGLQYLHDHGIIHRDIKPANFLLGHSLDDLKISDFGLAKSLINAVSKKTKTGMIGTFDYMSPEVISSQKYSFPSDIYALSITIWEMLHRKDPYEKYADNHFRIITEVVSNNLRPTITIDLPLNNLLQWGWDANPEKRPSLTEFIDFASSSFEPNKKTQLLYVGKDSEEVGEQIKNSFMILGGFWYSDLNIGPIEREMKMKLYKVYSDFTYILNSKQKKWNNLYLQLPRELSDHGSVMINGEIYIFGGYDGQEYFKELYKIGENMEWIQLADMNEKKRGIGNSSVVFDDEIWVFGGGNVTKSLKSVEKYNPKTDTWTMMPEMNTAKFLSAVSIINEKFYVSGGNNLKTIEVYDPEEKEWKIFCEMPFALMRHASIADGTNLIIIGGDKSYEKPSDEVWKIDVLDPEKKWIKMTNLNKKRYRHFAAKLSDGFTVIGGMDDSQRMIDTLEIFDGRKWAKREVKYSKWRSGSSFIPLTTKDEKLLLQREDDLTKRWVFLHDKELIEEGSIMILGGKSKAYLTDANFIYNSKEKKWNQIYLKLPSNLYNNGSVMINGEIYIFGGHDGLGHLKELYKLGEKLEWIQLADMNEKRADIGNSSVVFDDEIWVFGGENEANKHKSVEKYNPKTNTWTMMLEMKEERRGSAVSIINGKFYVSGGHYGNNFFKTIEVYDPKKNKWEIFCEMPLGLSRHVSLVKDTDLIIIGGQTPQYFESSDEVWKINVLDPEKKWIKMPNLQQERYEHGAVKLTDELMVFGGVMVKEQDLEMLDSVEIFDGSKWTKGNKLSEKCSAFSLIQLTPKE